MIVRERERGNSQRTKDRGKLRFTRRGPHVQAIFADLAVLRLVQQELRAFVPGLPIDVVRYERRQIPRPELPCTCVLPCVRAIRTEGMAETHTPFPYYYQVAACPRHAQLLPKPCTQPLASLVQQQVPELPGRAYPEVLLVIDEPLALTGRGGKTNSAAQLAAEFARKGRKFVLYG